MAKTFSSQVLLFMAFFLQLSTLTTMNSSEVNDSLDYSSDGSIELFGLLARAPSRASHRETTAEPTDERSLQRVDEIVARPPAVSAKQPSTSENEVIVLSDFSSSARTRVMVGKRLAPLKSLVRKRPVSSRFSLSNSYYNQRFLDTILRIKVANVSNVRNRAPHRLSACIDPAIRFYADVKANAKIDSTARGVNASLRCKKESRRCGGRG